MAMLKNVGFQHEEKGSLTPLAPYSQLQHKVTKVYISLDREA